MLRRKFITLAAGAAQIARASAPIGIGVLGLRHSHATTVFQVIRSSVDWNVVGVCEPNPARRPSGVQVLSREELLSHPEIRVIAVESDVPEHAADGLAVVNAGKHLHLEKAPADTMAGLQRIVDVAREKKLTLQTGYMWRYHPGFAKVVEAAREGWLGSIYQVRASMHNQLPADQRSEWARFPGGVMYEFGGHMADPLLRILGRPTKVTPYLRRSGDLVDNAMAMLEWKGAIGVIQASNIQPNSGKHRALEVYGSNGTAIVSPIEPPSLVIDLEKPAGPYKAGFQTIPMPPYKRFEADFAELAAVLRGQRKLSVSYEDDLLLQDVLLRCCGMA
jgi:predicted dehydrogenase